MPDEIVDRYETVRRRKMYRQHNNQERKVYFRGIYDFLVSLKDIQTLKIRLHYQNLGPTTQQDISPISLTKFEHLEKAHVLFSVEKIIHDPDESLVIYQITSHSDQAHKMAYFFPQMHDLLEFCSLIEIKCITTDNETMNKVFEGIRYYKPDPTNFLIKWGDYTYTEPSRPNTYPQPKLLIEWIDLCRQHWDLFYPDVKGREVALDCWRDGKFFVRRKWSDGTRAVIQSPEDLDLVEEVQALSLIPNIHLQKPDDEGIIVPVEAMLDLDPISFTKGSEVFYLGNCFSNYLNTLGIKFLKRLSSGRHGGMHFIIPIHLEQPLPLIASTPPFDTYFARNKKDILVNSIRHSMEGLVLHYLVYWLKNEKYLRKVSLDSDKRKIRFDISRNTRYGGRRSLFSSHISTEKVVIPIPEIEMSFNQSEYYCELADISEAEKHINEFGEPNYQYLDIRHTNGQKIYRIAEEIAELWVDYQTERPNRFWNVTLPSKM
ncbi:MAG: hypothetical protein ACW967_00480 [Candidatus Hodarchaeales archaeon]